MNKANKMMVKFTFDTYDSLRKQVYDRIIDYINAGKADDIDLNDPLRATEIYEDIIESDRKLYFDLDNYGKMRSVLVDTFGFKRLFSSIGDELGIIMSAWQLIFLSVFIEHYHDIKAVWERRITSNG